MQSTALLEKNTIQSWHLFQKRKILGSDCLTRREIRLIEQTKQDVSGNNIGHDVPSDLPFPPPSYQ